MEKTILVVSGGREGKNAFQKTVKEKLNYWVWNVNPQNELVFIIGLLGWDGHDKDEIFQKFYNNLYDVAETNFDFKKTYVTRMIDRFLSHDKAQVLIIHQCDELIEDFKNYAGIISLFVGRNSKEIENNIHKYDKTILMDDTFDESVKNIMEILIKKEKV